MSILVVKIGSSVIAPSGVINNACLNQIIGDIEKVIANGTKVVVVTSGAVASGVKELGLSKRPSKIEELQAIASVGQIILMNHFFKGFSKYRRKCAQLLLTWDDFENRERYLNVKDTLRKLLSEGIVPVINENDAVSNEEIKFGDNDKLSALVANLIEADTLLILSDVKGLYSGDTLVRNVYDVDTEAVPCIRPHKKDSLTRGGMSSKIDAARISAAAGICMVIASGSMKNIIQKVAAREPAECTIFHPAAEKVEAKKRWISFVKKEKGKLVIDSGAEKAVAADGKSLLLPGIISIEGDFHKGDAVVLYNQCGSCIAKGIVGYSAEALRHGKNVKQEVIHRDSLVIHAAVQS